MDKNHSQNGVSDRQGNLDDLQRIYYYKHYINQVNYYKHYINQVNYYKHYINWVIFSFAPIPIF